MSDKKQILSALPGFEPLTSEPKDTIGFRTVSRRNYDPPDYVVAFLFLEILKYRNFGPSDKIRWHTYFLFKDHTFLLRDFKFDVWELEAREEGAFGGKILSEVLARIKAAARYAGRILEKELRKRIDKEDFWINNGYPALRAAFDFYLTEARRAEEARKSWENAEPRRFNEGQHLDRALGYRALPLMVSFLGNIHLTNHSDCPTFWPVGDGAGHVEPRRTQQANGA